jgi:hypothetical protein
MYSSLCNNLINLKFKIKNLHTNGHDIEKMINRITIQAFDILGNAFTIAVFYKEKMQVVIDNNFVIDVYNEFNSKDIYQVINRSSLEYSVFIEKKIDTSVIGYQNCYLGFYDHLTGQYFSKICNVEVLDLIPPEIYGSNNIYLLDQELLSIDEFNFTAYFIVKDNYSSNFTYDICYYYNNMKITNLTFAEALLKYQMLEVKIIAYDESLNKSNEFYQQYYILDTLPPIIEIDEIIIYDYNICEEELFKFIKITDNISTNCAYELHIYDLFFNEYKMENLVNAAGDYYLEISAIDEANNKSAQYNTCFKIIDTTPPIIISEKEIYLKDILIEEYDFFNIAEVYDNSNCTTTITIEYYFNNIEITEYEAKSLLLKGNNINIIYNAVDESDNAASKELLIIPIDTLAPEIITNLKDGKIYFNQLILNCTAIDNFDNNPVIEVYINNEYITDYLNYDFNNGKYTIVIKTVDNSGNMEISEYVITIMSVANSSIEVFLIVITIVISCVYLAIKLLKKKNHSL